MSISPLSTNVAYRAYPAAAANPAPAPAPMKSSLLRKAEEEAADVAVALGKIPFLGKLGVKLYGLLCGKPKAGAPALDNLGDLAPKLERGAQPTEAGFAELAKQGVNTVINLRPESNWEGPAVQKNGMKYVYLPLPPIGAPSNQQALQFLSIVTDPANGKSFFHCQHGADRTGAMAAAYRIAVQGWTADQAIAEMPQYRFHTGLEDEKLVFVKQFAQYWSSLPAATKAQVLHQGLNATA